MLGKLSKLLPEELELLGEGLLDVKGADDEAELPPATTFFPPDMVFVNPINCNVCNAETTTIAPISTVNSMFVFNIFILFTSIHFIIIIQSPVIFFLL